MTDELTTLELPSVTRPKNHPPRSRLLPLTLALHLSVAMAAMAPLVAAAQVRSYSIPPGPLGAALTRLRRRPACRSRSMPSHGRLAIPGLSGTHGVEEGFAELLKGSGYSIEENVSRLPAGARRGADRRRDRGAARHRYRPQRATARGDRCRIAPNMEAAKAPQTVQIIEQEAIARQLALSTNSSDALSNLIPS